MSHVDGVDDGIGYGVKGTSTTINGKGVYAKSEGERGYSIWAESSRDVDAVVGIGGVVGITKTGPYGVAGVNEGKPGVIGASDSDVGVTGFSRESYGIHGASRANAGVIGQNTTYDTATTTAEENQESISSVENESTDNSGTSGDNGNGNSG